MRLMLPRREIQSKADSPDAAVRANVVDVAKGFANGLLNPPCIAGNRRASRFRASARKFPICRAFLGRPKTQLLIAMQKVVGSSPISRFGKARNLLQAFLVQSAR
jgi:hypothetical protein